jgi:hypothetical protein
MHAFIPTAATPNTTIHLIRHHRESVDTCYLSGQVMAALALEEYSDDRSEKE